MRGVPVVCSDRCGAYDLLREPWRGEIYPWHRVDSLAEILERRIAAGPVDNATRRRISNWSRCIEGPSVADYFLAVIEHIYAGGPRPDAAVVRIGSGA